VPTSPQEWCQSGSSAASPSQDRRQLFNCLGGSLAHLGWRPILITGVLRQLLVHHFANLTHVEEPDLRTAPWREGPDTGILIESVHRFRADVVEKRPAIYVKRNGYKNLRIGINDHVGTDGQGENYVTLWVGSHTLFCVHGTGASTEILGSEVQRELTQFGPVIRQQLGFKKFQVLEVGGIGELEEATENFVVPVTVGWAYEETWQISQEALRLMAVEFEFTPNSV
jgi:hypothetical protein